MERKSNIYRNVERILYCHSIMLGNPPKIIIMREEGIKNWLPLSNDHKPNEDLKNFFFEIHSYNLNSKKI